MGKVKLVEYHEWIINNATVMLSLSLCTSVLNVFDKCVHIKYNGRFSVAILATQQKMGDH